ncbi:hypothetical protein Tco_0132097 [Tanacetum coccineum]
MLTGMSVVLLAEMRQTSFLISSATNGTRRLSGVFSYIQVCGSELYLIKLSWIPTVSWEEPARRLTVIAPKLPIIDIERQPDAAAGAFGVAQDALIVDEGGQADPAPVQAPPPPPAPARTMPQRKARLEEDVHEMRGALTEQREVINAMACDFSRFSTWAVTGLAWMMDRAGVSYVPYFETHVPYQRLLVRQRTGKASTSAAQEDPQQPDP